MSQTLGLEKALDVAMEAELKAQAFYAQAAVEVQDPRGRDLLSRLAAFEQYHYQKLSDQAAALRVDGRFVDYEPRTMADLAPLPLGGETGGTLLGELRDPAAILGKAIDNEKIAEERYTVLAGQTLDPAGQAMFRALATEERLHQRILEDEFYSLSNKGVWGWTGLYGE